MVHTQGWRMTWWHPIQKGNSVPCVPKKRQQQAQKNKAQGNRCRFTGKLTRENDHPCRQRRGFPQKEDSAPHNLRACCGQTEAPHGSSGQDCNQDGSSRPHVWTQQCGRTPHRGGQQHQHVMWGKIGPAGGPAHGRVHAPQDKATRKARKKPPQRHWDQGRKSPP